MSQQRQASLPKYDDKLKLMMIHIVQRIRQTRYSHNYNDHLESYLIQTIEVIKLMEEDKASSNYRPESPMDWMR
jgi:hypothetical protein